MLVHNIYRAFCVVFLSYIFSIFFSQMKDLALLYNTCKIHPLVKLSRQTMLEVAHSAIQRYQQLSRSCQSLRVGPSAELQQQKQIVMCCMSAVVPSTNVRKRKITLIN